MAKKLIDLKSYIKNPFLRGLYGLFQRPFESFMGIRDLNRSYEVLRSLSGERNFFDRALSSLDGSYQVSGHELKKIPKEGPLIVVANHPMGGLDGIVLGALLCQVRPDVKLLANYLLGHMEEIKPWLIPVDPFGGNAATSSNISAMKDTIRHLKKGGCIATFPSGTVSYFQPRNMSVSDPEWNTNLATLARKTGATILPIYFRGRNSNFFQLAGLLHPRLRTALLVRELVRKAKRETVRMRIGSPLLPRKIAAFETDEELTAWMRLNTYILAQKKLEEEAKREASAVNSFFQFGHIKSLYNKIMPRKKPMQDLILPIDPALMQPEIDELPESAKLVSGERVSVYAAYAWQIKWTMLEIGRLREKTFREVGEGTGKSVDTDEYDQYYMHIFMWDSENKKIMGAYRVGHVDKIVHSIGPQGLYATTLFKMRPELLEKMGHALEMGRSFVTSEYQKKRSTLAILWRGIGVYLARNPQYKTLYGPVSITTEYNSISKDLMVQFLSQHKTSADLAKFVKAKTPPKVRLNYDDKKAISCAGGDIDKISALISEIEVDNKGIPVLLKHYLRLNGELLAFNVDKSFNNCIDGLIMVDMCKTDPKLLKSYMGLKEAIAYRKYHGLDTPELEAELKAQEEANRPKES